MTGTITHHLSDALLMGYSSGSLPEAFNLVVATHVSVCDDCRAALAAYDSVGGALLDGSVLDGAADTGSMDEGSLEATLAMIRAGGPSADAGEAGAEATGAVDIPAPLAAYVGGGLDRVRWRAAGMGVKQAILATSPQASARLLFIPAGAAMPDHGHHGLEVTMVLRGAFMDEDARFGPGDVEIADTETEHTPIADIGEDCICLAVADGKLKFRGLLPRLAQPFLRI